jgi:predicted outer membrane repeat protein
MRKSLLATGLVLALLLAAVPVPVAHAADQVVINTDDSGSGSLRWAIGAVHSGGTITFSLSYPATITLTSGNLNLSKNVTIDGPGASNLTISGGNTRQIFHVNGGYTLNLDDVTLTQGVSSNGGAIWNYNGTVNISNCTLSNNGTGDSVTCSSGGAIRNEGNGTVTIDSSTFANNSCVNGGAIQNYGTLSIDNSTFESNSATSGAGIYSGGSSADLDITDSTFHDNQSTSSGGAILIDNGMCDISGTVLYDNSAGAYGAGIRCSGSSSSTTVTVENSTFSGNSAASGGGGISYSGPTLYIYNATFYGNSAPATRGAGLYGTGTLTMDNTLFHNNTRDCHISGTVSANNNLDDGSTCFGRIGAVTNLDLDYNLALNGGPTLNHALLPNTGNNAIDTGYAATCRATDQRGVTRPQDGDGNGSAICDIGAFEYQQSNYVELLSFSAEAQGRAVMVAWETAVELDNAGFNLYRAGSADGPRTQLNAQLIASQAAFGGGASYSFRDRPGTGTFTYWLEDVAYDGARTLHGPVQVQTGRPGLLEPVPALVPAPSLAPDR